MLATREPTPTRWRATDDGPAVVESEAAVREVLGLLDDADCRDILEVTSERAYSAGELTDACDVPRSTIYRKVEQLTDAGLLHEGIRIRRNGKHTREYARAVDAIEVAVETDGGFTLHVSRRPDGE